MTKTILRQFSGGAFALLLIMTLLAPVLTGCSRTTLMSLPNQDVVSLSPNDICAILLRAGFDDKEIVRQGANLRDALACVGAAQIRSSSRTEAIFAVHVPYVHVTSRKTGIFVFDVRDSKIR